jgi:hypothetical protein
MLANTLAHADDDEAMRAFGEALDKLDGADARLEYVIEALRTSSHPRAPEVLERGAHRFFATLEGAAKRLAKKDAQGPTLDNIFSVETHLVQALHILLRRRDARALALASKTHGHTTGLRLFGTCIGHALRVSARFGDRASIPRARAYLDRALTHLAEVESVDDAVALNATEASLALAKLEPAETEAYLLAAFDQKREYPDADLGARAVILAGLLQLRPNDPALLAWLERFLGDRSGSMRVYACLRAVEEGKIGPAAPWALPHLYGRRTSLTGKQTGYWLFAETARDALAALGEARAPAFDDTDAFAIRVANEDLAAALGHPERHYRSNVFEKIRVKKVTGPPVIRAARDVLADLYRWSSDEHTRVSAADDARKEGVRALFLQGPQAAEAFGELIELPHIAADDRTLLTIAQRLSGQERVVRSWLLGASKGDVLAEIQSPRRAFRGFVDLFAARAMVLGGGNDVEKAVADAFSERVAWANTASANDLMLLQLAYVAARLDAGREVIERCARDDGMSLYYVKEPLLRSLTLEKIDPSHDFGGGPAALTLQLGMDGYSDDSRPTNHLTLAVSDTRITWESSGSGYMMGMFGLLDGDGTRGAFRCAGELALESRDAATARAREELLAATLLGYRVDPRAARTGGRARKK